MELQTEDALHRPARAATARLPLFVVLLTLLTAFVRFGYSYGSGDQDELVPSVLHLLDGSLFTQDWLVQAVTSGVNVRTYFLWLTTLPSLVLPPWLVFFGFWVLTTGAVAYGVHALALELVRDRLAAAAGVFVALAVVVKWTLGGNALVSSAFLPEPAAWALAMPAIVLFLRRKRAWAGALLGLAAWFHLLAGAQTALVLVLIGLGQAVAHADLSGQRFRAEALDLVRFSGAFVLVGLPILVPVALDQLAPASPTTVPPFYVHAQFRNPHHHLFFSFELGHHVRFWPLVLGGLVGGGWLARRGELRHGRALVAGGIVIAVLCAVAVVFVEVVPVTVVAKLQFFKLTVLVTLFCSLLLAAAAARLLPAGLRRLGERVLGARWAGLAATTVLVVVVGAMGGRGTGRPGAMLEPVRHLASPLGEAERWARAETPRDALFAIPPSVSSFRSFARRAVVADFTGFVFTDAAMQEWFERLMDVAPIPPPETGRGVKPVLDAAYHRQPAEAWRQLRSGYGIDYVLVERAEAALPFEVAFENDHWRVYRLAEDA